MNKWIRLQTAYKAYKTVESVWGKNHAKTKTYKVALIKEKQRFNLIQGGNRVIVEETVTENLLNIWEFKKQCSLSK